MTQFNDQARRRIAEFLPAALETALESYQEFVERPPLTSDKGEKTNDRKAFSDHHTSCKAALSHIELLLKLSEKAHLPDPAIGAHRQQLSFAMLRQEAQEQIRREDLRNSRDGG